MAEPTLRIRLRYADTSSTQRLLLHLNRPPLARPHHRPRGPLRDRGVRDPRGVALVDSAGSSPPRPAPRACSASGRLRIVALVRVSRAGFAYAAWTSSLGVALGVGVSPSAWAVRATIDGGGDIWQVISVAINVIILYYLFQPNIKALFRRA